jgi:hypothetical protein
MIEKLRAAWRRVPFRHMTLLVLVLYVFGRKQPFPLTHFPMYSRFSQEADVLYVTDQADRPVSMDALFGTGSSSVKKRFKSELSRVLKRQKDTEQATPEERAEAGKTILAGLVDDVKRKAIPADLKSFRLYSRTFRLEDYKLKNIPPELLAEQPWSAL